MTAPRGAFDAEAYNAQFGPALSGIAGFQAADQAGAVDADSQPNYEQEQGVQRQNVSSINAAPLPSPLQQERMMDRQQPPPGANLGGGKPNASGPTSNASSGAFYDPNGPHQSAPVYHAVDNMTDEQAKAHVRNIDEQASGDNRHDANDFNEVYNRTFNASLKAHAEQHNLDEQTVAQMQNPSWRDKLSMFLDASNRAGAIHAQNPQMSKGDIWAVATRGALDGWQAHVQGAHDAYMDQQAAFQKQASSDANAAVKRASDTLGLQAKADELRLNQQKADETKRHNMADEANNKTKAGAEVAKEGAAAKKGDLITGDDGYLYSVGADGQAKQVKDQSGQPVKGTKAGVNSPNAGNEERSTKDAQAALDKAEGAVEKEEAAKAKDPMNIGKKPMTAEEKSARAKEILRTTNPKAYKTLYGSDPNNSPAPAPAGAATNDDDVPPSMRQKK